MKNCFLYIVFVLFIFAACTKHNDTSTTPLNETIPPDTASLIVVKGAFANGPNGNVSGNAAVYLQNGKYTLALESVTISNGPDLHVYLSKEATPADFIDLGKLKSTTGNQLYNITGSPDFTVYKYALIHCQQYNHLFGIAPLK